MKTKKIGMQIGIFAIGAIAFVALVVFGVQSWMRLTSDVEHYAYLVKRNPENFEYHEMYGYALQDAGRFVEAEREYRLELNLRPASKSGRYLLGKTLVAQGRYSEAQKELRLALDGARPPLARDIRAELDALPPIINR